MRNSALTLLLATALKLNVDAFTPALLKTSPAVNTARKMAEDDEVIMNRYSR
jgi:hypothetical protein